MKDKKRNKVIRKTLGVAYITDKIREARLRSCDEKRGRKLHEKNYDSRGQRTPQSRTTEEATARHDTARQEVSLIKEITY